MDRTTTENVQFYIDLINAQGNVKIKLYMESGTYYIVKSIGLEAIYSGSLSELYYFLVGSQKLVNPLYNDYTVNGTYRTFMIVDSHCRNYFCNLAQISRIIEQNGLKPDYYTVYEFLNNKPKKCSKKHLNEMFAANKIDLKL